MGPSLEGPFLPPTPGGLGARSWGTGGSHCTQGAPPPWRGSPWCTPTPRDLLGHLQFRLGVFSISSPPLHLPFLGGVLHPKNHPGGGRTFTAPQPTLRGVRSVLPLRGRGPDTPLASLPARRCPGTDLRGVGRLLGGQHGVGAVLAGQVTHDTHGPPVLHAVQPQRLPVPRAARRPRRPGRGGRGQRRRRRGRPRRRLGGARRQPQLANDVHDVAEGAVGAEEALRDRLAALRAAEAPRRVLPALGHAGAAEVVPALGHQHRIVEVLQAHRARQLVLQAPRSAAGRGGRGGGRGRRLHGGRAAGGGPGRGAGNDNESPNSVRPLRAAAPPD